VTHDDAHLFTSLALIAMDGTPGAGWLFHAEAAAFQPPTGIIQQLLAFHTKAGRGPVTVAAINADHRRHCLPFSRQPRGGEVVFLSGGGAKPTRRGQKFNRHFHLRIITRIAPARFDSGQSF